MQKENSVIKNYILSSEIYQIGKEKIRCEQSSELLKNIFILNLLFYADKDCK